MSIPGRWLRTAGQAVRVHFNTSHLEQMGAVLCATLRDYWAPAEVSRVPQLLQHLELLHPPGGGPASARIVMVGAEHGPFQTLAIALKAPAGGTDPDGAACFITFVSMALCRTTANCCGLWCAVQTADGPVVEMIAADDDDDSACTDSGGERALSASCLACCHVCCC